MDLSGEGAIELFVVLPCYNEADGIEATLAALARQRDPCFSLVVVDNASTDATCDVVRDFAARHPSMAIHSVREQQKGTGAAADTGFRHAIALGATHVARTDADCLPREDWIWSLKRAFSEGSEFIAGRIGFRTDDLRVPLFRHAAMLGLMALMRATAPLLRQNRGPDYKVGYVLAAGCNLALTARLYETSGGFPRIDLETGNEDQMLTNRVRMVSDRVRRDRRVVVLQSTRRMHAYGLFNTLLWYWERKYRGSIVDIR